MRRLRPSQGVLDRELAPGESVQIILHGSATGFLLAPYSAELIGRVEYPGDVGPAGNYRRVEAWYDTSGSTASVGGVVFLDADQNGLRGPAGRARRPALWVGDVRTVSG